METSALATTTGLLRRTALTARGTRPLTMDLGQVFRHIFLRIFINYSSFAGAVDINIKENL